MGSEVGHGTTPGAGLTSGSANFDKALKNGFDNLISQYKDKNNRQKGGVKCNLDDSADSATDQPDDATTVDSDTMSLSNGIKPQNFMDVHAVDEKRKFDTMTTSSSFPVVSTKKQRTAKTPVRQSSLASSTKSTKKTSFTSVRKASPTTQTKPRFWQCSVCTFHNKLMQWQKKKQKCEMCDTPRKVENEVEIKMTPAGFVEIDCCRSSI